MGTCFLGRGALLVALNAPDAPYLQLTGESEIVVNFTEERKEIKDSRNGREESVGSFSSALNATLTAAAGKYEKETLAYLSKSQSRTVTANAVKTISVAVGGPYWLAPGLTAVTAVDAVAAALNSTHYTVDLDTGLITVLSIAGTTLPWTFTGTGVSYQANGLGVTQDLELKALVTGIDVISNRKFVAEFFRASLSMTDALTLVSREFKQSSITLNLLADNARGESDAVLGRFGILNFI